MNFNELGLKETQILWLQAFDYLADIRRFEVCKEFADFYISECSKNDFIFKLSRIFGRFEKSTAIIK